MTTTTTMMKALLQNSKGDNSVLQVGQVSRPSGAAAGELLVRVKACSVNPVDAMNRSGQGFVSGDAPLPWVLGYDATGVVEQVGAGVHNFRPGDHVWYSGNIAQSRGALAQYHTVDHRIVSRRPQSVSFAEASSIPLTGLTAWEALFEHFGIDPSAKAANATRTVLVIGASGGLGSIAVQLAKKHAGLQVVATAGRDETRRWVRELGADHVINHREDLLPQLKQIAGLHQGTVDYVFCCNQPDLYLDVAVDAVKPFGRVGFVLPIARALKNPPVAFTKAVSIHHIFMNTREFNQFQPEVHGRILQQLAELIDNGTIRHTLTRTFSLEQGAEAIAWVESGAAIGKAAVIIEE